MYILAADDEELALEYLKLTIQKAVPSAQVLCCSSAQQTLKAAKENQIDIFFLDIEMSDMNGLELARRLQKMRKNTNIIFVTGYDEYMGDAFNLLASGYILKPVNVTDIKKQIENLRYDVRQPTEQSGISVQCFGNFEVFCDGVPMQFTYSKAKELFAYLIDRQGVLCTGREIMAAIWDDDVSESYF